MFLNNPSRTGSSAETRLSPSSVNSLETKLKVLLGGPIAASAALVGGVAYVGSWDGNEYAVDLSNGEVLWKTFLGQTVNSKCFPPTVGVSSSAAVVDGVVYVGGGDSFWYALDAGNGNVLWRVPTGDNSATNKGGHYNWSSPLIWEGSAYIGLASACDNPSIRGGLLRVDLTTKKVAATFNAVPAGTRGGGIWSGPSVDPATKTIFVTTGEHTVTGQPRAQSMVALDATTLKVRSSWQVPDEEAVLRGDSDWSTSAILFSDASGRELVAGGNKNGVIYAFLRSDIAAGPIWRKEIAISGQCPVCGQGTVSSMAFGLEQLYVGGGNTTIDGNAFKGAVRAVNPATGASIWEKGLNDPVIASLAYSNGYVVVGDGPNIDVLDAVNGTVLWTAPTGSGTYAAPSISGGQIVLGLTDGNLWVLGTR